MHAENPREPAHDPLLQPFHLKHLRLKNRVMSTAHEPAYSEDGMPLSLIHISEPTRPY